MDYHKNNPNNIISRINQIYANPNFMLYAPPLAEINNKTLTKRDYYKNIENFFITNPGIFNVSNVIINQLKKEYTTFLLIDGENLLHRLKEYNGKSNITQADVIDILEPYYPKNICIIIFCQQHNIRVGKPYYNIDQQKANAKIQLFKYNNILPNQSEVDDIILMYFYISINTNSNYNAHVLTFDKNSWFDPKDFSVKPLVEHDSLYKKFFNEVKSLTENKNKTNLKDAIIESAKSISVMALPKDPPTLTRKYSLNSNSSSSSSSNSSNNRSRSRSRSRNRNRNHNRSRNRNRSRSRNRGRKNGGNKKTKKGRKYNIHRTRRII